MKDKSEVTHGQDVELFSSDNKIKMYINKIKKNIDILKKKELGGDEMENTGCIYCQKKGMCWIYRKVRKILKTPELSIYKEESERQIYNGISSRCFSFSPFEDMKNYE